MIIRLIQILYSISIVVLIFHIAAGPPMGESETGLWDIGFVVSGAFCILSGPLTWIAGYFSLKSTRCAEIKKGAINVP